MAIASDYPQSKLRTGTFKYKNEVYHIDRTGNLYRWHSHDDLGGFFSSIGKVLQKVNAAPLNLVKKVASLTPITQKLAEKDILLKIEAKRVEFENKHLYDPTQVKKDLKVVLPIVIVAVATYFGFGSVASAALSAYNQRKAKLEQQRAQAAADSDAQRLIDEQIRQTDAEIARLNGTAKAATADQQRLDALVVEWNKNNDLLATDPKNAATYNARMNAIESEMTVLSNKSKNLPTITMPNADPVIDIKPAPVVAAQAEGWTPAQLPVSSGGTTAASSGLLPQPLMPNIPTQSAPAYAASVQAMQSGQPLQTSPQATEAVTAFFSRAGTETGPGVIDVTKPDPGTPAAKATDAASWIKPLLIGGAALVTLAK
jgi:uncharacterized protein (UPF0333 family)